MYNYKVSPISRREMVRIILKCSLTMMKSLLSSFPHSNFVLPLNSEKKGRALSADLEMNRVKIVISLFECL